MNKLLLLASLVMMGLSGCYVVPNRGHDDGYRNGRDHRDHGGDRRDRDGHEDDRRGDDGNHDGYH